jgi:peptidoglycan hydrolase-like protein with peptidoglycan-binding domain
MQYTLYELGYYDGAVDGVYGQTTADAVRAFQISNSVQPVDGIAGNATLSKLYSSGAVAATTPYEQYTTVRPGDVGDSVAQVQDCLVEFGYLELENVNGVYDDVTTQAVKNFQAAWNLTVDGVAGAETQKILFGF